MKRGDENESERNLRLEKDVASKQLWLAVEREEDKTAKLENDGPTKLLRLAMETDDERKARLEKMVDTTQLRLALETEEEKKEEHKEMDLILYLFSKTHFFSRNELARPVMGTIFLVSSSSCIMCT